MDCVLVRYVKLDEKELKMIKTPRAKLDLLEMPIVKFLRSPNELPTIALVQYVAVDLQEAVKRYRMKYGRKPLKAYRHRTSKGQVWSFEHDTRD